MTTHVHVLNTGVSRIDEHILFSNCERSRKLVTIPILAFLIKTENSKILVDTSFESPERPDLKAGDYQRPLGTKQELAFQLKQLDVSVDDVDVVVNTHLHEDHCGNNKLFKNSRFLVQKEELRHAFVPDDNERDRNGPFYKRIDFDHPLDYEPITGDYAVTEEVRILFTPGHTAGHQSVAVRLANRNFVIASDAVFTEKNWRDNVDPGLVYDARAYADSIRKLKSVPNALVYFSHDLDFFERSPHEFS
jgi:glyoxylase-like metal-dependent hydrolase (beta-lactamase superfamily II)